MMRMLSCKVEKRKLKLFLLPLGFKEKKELAD